MAAKPVVRDTRKQSRATGGVIKTISKQASAVQSSKRTKRKAVQTTVVRNTAKSSVGGARRANADENSSKKDKGPVAMDVGLFYAFAQCSLKMEASHLMGRDFSLKDPEAVKIWPQFEKMAARNLGKNEKWVPWHTVLGVHEKFVVDEIHHAQVPFWTDYHRFVAMFIFRCHCKRDMFLEVQMPYLTQKSFWKNPVAGFADGCSMEKDMLKFRATGRALQTACFLIIPERILKNDDENLVRNIMIRSRRLVQLADKLWEVVNAKTNDLNSEAKYESIKKHILEVQTLGDTWVKMLMVCVDICKPHLQLLHKRCEVGIGAADPMRKLLEDEGLLAPRQEREQNPHGTMNFGDGVAVCPSIRSGVIAVKRDGVQLIQVTRGMAGSVDRAHAVAVQLAEISLKRKFMPKDQEILKKRRQELFDDKSLKVPKLDLDAKMKELQKMHAEGLLPERQEKQQGPSPSSKALSQLCQRINNAQNPSTKQFWNLLKDVETHGRKFFKASPLTVAQMNSSTKKEISAVTLQVQLCEFRQFENYIRRPSLKRPGACESARE